MLNNPHTRQHNHQGNQAFLPNFFEKQHSQNQQWNRIQNSVVPHHGNGNQYQDKHGQIFLFFQPVSIGFPDIDQVYDKQHHKDRQRAVLPHEQQNPVGLRIGSQEKLRQNQSPYRETPFGQRIHQIAAGQAVQQ